MKVLVLGGRVVGVTAAYYLLKEHIQARRDRGLRHAARECVDLLLKSD